MYRNAFGARGTNQQAVLGGGYLSFIIRWPRSDLWALKSLVSFESRCEFGVSGDQYLIHFTYSSHRASGGLVSTTYELQGGLNHDFCCLAVRTSGRNPDGAGVERGSYDRRRGSELHPATHPPASAPSTGRMLNVRYGVSERIIGPPGCREAFVTEKWVRAVPPWTTATTDKLIEFENRFVGARYVIDAGTAKSRPSRVTLESCAPTALTPMARAGLA